MEGILPAPESSHAIKVALDEAKRCIETGEEKTILFGLTGTGYFDMYAYEKFHDGKMSDYVPSDDEIAAELHDSLGQLASANPDLNTLVLGCTHYPLARDIIAREYPQFTNIIDPAMGQVEQLRACLAANNAFNEHGGSLRVFTSGECAKNETLAARLGMKLTGPATHLHVATPLCK